jgi:hypothetical protein
MPRWLLPWLVPVTVVVIIVLVASLGLFGAVVVVAVLGPLLVTMRLRYLKANPPDPELETKPFWKF